MASALLASRGNEPCWGERKVYMRKNPNSNPNPNRNPNPKHKSKPSSIHRKSPPTTNPALSDDSSSLNRKFTAKSSHGGGGAGGRGEYVTFNISAFSRRELKDLKKRFISELKQVRNLSDRIESREFQSRSGYSTTAAGGLGGREVTSLTNRLPPPHIPNSSPSPSTCPDDDAAAAAAAAQGGGGSKRSLPLVDSGRDPKRSALELESRAASASSVQPATARLLSDMMKKCNVLLTKLMKQKLAWIFNTPVDVIGMGLHDYNRIIKHPMDLGTVKSKLRRNLYSTPLDFASDVRLTFNNALTYNPSGHDVYLAAQNLLSFFEQMFEHAYTSYEDERHNIVTWAERMKHKTSVVVVPNSPFHHKDNHDEKQTRRLLVEEEEPEPKELMTGFPRMNSWNQNRRPSSDSASRRRPDSRTPMNPTQPTAPTQFVSKPSSAATATVSATRTTGIVKLPKPKAKDKNKRDMSFEEKQKLSLNLQNLPQEKMDQVVHIIKKRNPDLAQQGDEIEVDIEAVDKETLWELDRFIGYFKKMMSKMKRQALVAAATANQNSSEATPAQEQGGHKYSIEEETPTERAAVVSANKKTRKGEIGAAAGVVEEEIDIGEDMPANNFPPVEIDKDAGGGGGVGGGGGYASRSSSSSSSSSSSDDSSSSDSDSGSSSGSDTDDDVRSPIGGGGQKQPPVGAS